MGPEEKHEYMIQFNGKMVANLSTFEDVGTFTLLQPEAEPIIASTLWETAFKAHVQMPKQWRCNNRKRFIKLLMSYGFPHNEAEQIAAIPARKDWYGLSFQQLFFYIMAVISQNIMAGDTI